MSSLKRKSVMSGADLGGPTPPTFEAQSFAVTVTPLHGVLYCTRQVPVPRVG